MHSEKIEALHIVALELDARKKEGTSEYDEAVRFVEEAKRLWREQLWNDKCKHCNETREALEQTRKLLVDLRARAGKIRQMQLMRKEFDDVVNRLFEL